MVSPEGAGSEPDRPKLGRGLLFAIAGLVIVAGFMVLGSLSPADPVALETTTTTSTIATTISTTTTTELPPPFDPENFEVSQIETGPQFEWTHTLTLDDGYPLGLIEHSGSLYLFVKEQALWTGAPGKLDLWEWQDSGSWQHSGTIAAADHSITAMTSNGDEVILAGLPAEGGAVSIWRSTDLETWVMEDIPIASEEAHSIALPTAVGANGDLVVVAAVVSENNQAMIEAALREAGVPVDLNGLGWGFEDDAVAIYGPFGMSIERVPYSDLGWDEDTQAAIVRAYHGPSRLSTWVQREGGEWLETELEDINGVDSILRHPDGGLMARGWGTTGMVSLFSSDGLEWSEVPANQAPWMVRVWGGLLVGPGERSLPGLLVSDNGEVWEHIGPEERFPVGINWSTDAVAAGPDGLVFTTSGSSPGLPATQPGSQPTTLDLATGATLTLDFYTGKMEVAVGDETFDWEMYSQDGPGGGVVADLEAGTLTLHDPETGDLLGQVSFEDLLQLEQDYYRSREPESHRALVYTPDGEIWSIQDVGAEFGRSSGIGHMVIDAGQVAVVVFPDWWLGIEGGFEVWTAPLP